MIPPNAPEDKLVSFRVLFPDKLILTFSVGVLVSLLDVISKFGCVVTVIVCAGYLLGKKDGLSDGFSLKVCFGL